MKLMRVLGLYILAIGLFFPASGWAQSRGGSDSLLLIGASAGFGGEFNGDVNSTIPLGGANINLGGDVRHVDMEPSWGAMVHWDTGVQKYLALGGRLSLLAGIDRDRADDNWSRDLVLNLDFAPRLRFPFAATPAEIYLAVPLGLSIFIPSDDWEHKNNLDLGAGAGFNVSILAGVTFEVTESLGVFLEAGWWLQNFSLNGKTTRGIRADVSLDGDFSQFALNFGVMLPL